MLMPPTPALMSLQQALPRPHAHDLASPSLPNGQLSIAMMMGRDAAPSACPLLGGPEGGSPRPLPAGMVSEDDEDDTYSLDEHSCSQDDQGDDMFYDPAPPAGDPSGAVRPEDDKDEGAREGATAGDDERTNHLYRELF